MTENVAETFRCGAIAIVGRPNVGKSTLLNHLIGQKVSITSKKAQTTRHRITGIYTDESAQFLFLDTPGFQKTHENALNKILNRTVGQAASDADVLLFVTEALKFSELDEVVLLVSASARAFSCRANKAGSCIPSRNGARFPSPRFRWAMAWR